MASMATRSLPRLALLLGALLPLVAPCACHSPARSRSENRAPSPSSILGEPASAASRSAVRVVKLHIRDRTSPDDQVVRFRRAELGKVVRALVSAQPGFRLDEADRGGPAHGVAHTLSLDLELQSIVGTEKGKASVLVSAQLQRRGAPVDEPAYMGNTLKEKVYVVTELRSLRGLYLDLLSQAIAEVLRSMGLEARLRVAPAHLVAHAIRTSRVDELDQGWTGQVDVWQPVAVPGQLTLLGDLGLPGIAALLRLGWSAPASTSGEGVDVRELAIKIAAIRRLKPAVKALTTVLQQERRQRIRDLCLGALAEIGDPAAVPALVKYTRGGDEQRVRKVIGVLGQLGGKEAQAYLEMIADNYQDDEVKKLARETLARLRQGSSTP